MMEGGAFPSDQYAVASQARFHGYDPKEAIIELFPREGEFALRTEDILQKIDEHADELALVLFGGVNYYTGQCFDMKAITEEPGHKAGHCEWSDLTWPMPPEMWLCNCTTGILILLPGAHTST